MYPKDKRICPCCGKTSELITPSKEDLPRRVEESANKIQYYFQCRPRFFSYTRRPKTGFVIPRDRGYFLDKNIDRYGRLAVVPRGNDCFIQTVPYTRRRLKKDRLFFFDRELVFLCGNCRKKLSIDRNPFYLFHVPLFLFLLAVMILAMLLPVIMAANEASLKVLKVIFFFAIGSMLLTVPVTAFISAYYFWVKKRISNFVPTDEYDTLVKLPENLKISGVLSKKYLHPYNVYETELDGERFFLYLTEKGKRDHKLHICGLEGEQERLLSIIREKQNRGETVTLPLTFEGKAMGSADILETYDPPEPAEQDDDAEYITVWQCRHCGYDNPAGVSECRSCGKWKE